MSDLRLRPWKSPSPAALNLSTLLLAIKLAAGAVVYGAHQGSHIPPGAGMVVTRLRASDGLFVWVFIMVLHEPQRGSQVCRQTPRVTKIDRRLNTERKYRTDRRLNTGHPTAMSMGVPRCTGVPVGRTGWILR